LILSCTYDMTYSSNHDAENMLVKATRPTLVQRLGCKHDASYNENPVDWRAADVT
jgi:hypothetical protein